MVPFVDLKRQHESIEDELREAILRTVSSCQFVLGREVEQFEREFADYCEVRHAVAVSSGTSALHLALLAAGVGPGDEVVTVACTFVATVAAVEYAGARPILVDVDEETLTMDPAQVEEVLTERTRALLPVHLHGQPADMAPLQEIARRHGLVLIEDAAQAHGAEYQGRRVGSLGEMGCFSFYPGKNLGACGEGGCITTNSADHARTLRMLRDWGQAEKYRHVLKGFNYRMDGIQGAALRVKLRHLEDWTEARRRHAGRYRERLAGAAVQLPVERPDCRHVYHVFALRSPERDALQAGLAEREIQTGIHYPIPVHLQPAYADLGYGPGSLPVTESVSERLLSLPMFAELSDGELNEVSAGVHELAGS